MSTLFLCICYRVFFFIPCCPNQTQSCSHMIGYIPGHVGIIFDTPAPFLRWQNCHSVMSLSITVIGEGTVSWYINSRTYYTTNTYNSNESLQNHLRGDHQVKSGKKEHHSLKKLWSAILCNDSIACSKFHEASIFDSCTTEYNGMKIENNLNWILTDIEFKMYEN